MPPPSTTRPVPIQPVVPPPITRHANPHLAAQQTPVPQPPPPLPGVAAPSPRTPTPPPVGTAGNGPKAIVPQTGVPAAPPAPNPYQGYEDLLAQHDASWGQQQGQLQNNYNNQMRTNDLVQARAGRNGLGGGNAMANAQTAVAGSNQIAGAKLASDEARRGIFMNWLGAKTDDRHRSEEHGWAQEAAKDADTNHVRDMIYQQTGEMPQIGPDGKVIQTSKTPESGPGAIKPGTGYASQNGYSDPSQSGGLNTVPVQTEGENWVLRGKNGEGIASGSVQRSKDITKEVLKRAGLPASAGPQAYSKVQQYMAWYTAEYNVEPGPDEVYAALTKKGPFRV